MQYKHAQLILDLFSVSLDWRHRPNNNKYTTRLMTAMGAWIQRLSYSSSSFLISWISVICSYRTFPNLIIIYMCIPELFYNILLLCVNIRLFRSVKNRSSPDLIDTQSCTGSWTFVVQKNMKCSIGFWKFPQSTASYYVMEKINRIKHVIGFLGHTSRRHYWG